MKLIINCFIIIGCCAVIFSCAPDDVSELQPILDPSQLQYSVTQEPGYDNKIFLESLTPQVIPFWDYELGTSNKFKDTVVLPFKGDIWVKYQAMGQGGSSIDSTMITISENDVNYFSDPAWQKLTNGTEGRSWKLIAVKCGDARSQTYNDWGDAGWVTADFGDSVHFDLNQGFNFVRYTKGVPTKSTFSLDTNEILPKAYLNTPGKALVINGGNRMPAQDVSNEMLPDLKNRFRIYKLSNDTLILGQGGYYTSNPANTFSYWHWYVRTH